MTKLTADRIPELLDDLAVSNAELKAVSLQAGDGWGRRHAEGKWSAGQHVEHVGLMLGIGAASLEAAAAQVRAGTLPRRPWRDLLQTLFVRLATGRSFPRGAKAMAASTPGGAMDRDRAFALLDDGLRRHRDLAAGLTGEQQDRLWIWNPFIRLRWHYTLPEILRVQANHTRLHARHVAEGLAVVAVARPIA